MFVRDIEFLTTYDGAYNVNIIPYREDLPIEIRQITQRVCMRVLHDYIDATPIRVQYGCEIRVPLYIIDDINDRIFEEILHSPNARADIKGIISFWCDSIKSNIYIRDNRNLFEFKSFNTTTYTEKYTERHMGKYGNFSNKI